MSKTALVCGGGGFIGSHLVKRLKAESFWVRGVDLKLPRFRATEADDFIVGDLRDHREVMGDVEREDKRPQGADNEARNRGVEALCVGIVLE